MPVKDAQAKLRSMEREMSRLIEWQTTLNKQNDAKITKLRDAILWALGVNGEFRTRGEMEGQYYWRDELRVRAGITARDIHEISQRDSK